MLNLETTIVQAQQRYVPTNRNPGIHKTQQLAFVLVALTELLLLVIFAFP